MAEAPVEAVRIAFTDLSKAQEAEWETSEAWGSAKERVSAAEQVLAEALRRLAATDG